jgi:hypothetical protein
MKALGSYGTSVWIGACTITIALVNLWIQSKIIISVTIASSLLLVLSLVYLYQNTPKTIAKKIKVDRPPKKPNDIKEPIQKNKVTDKTGKKKQKVTRDMEI